MVSGVVYTIKEVRIVWVSTLNYVELAKKYHIRAICYNVAYVTKKKIYFKLTKSF